MIRSIKLQIENITTKLIENGLTIRENFPADRGNVIIWSSHKSVSSALSSRKYDLIYQQFLNEGEYNFILGDGAIIQMMYEVSDDRERVLKHRLAYFPKPQAYNEMDVHFEQPIESLPVPIRFDFDTSEAKFQEVVHSFSHCTLGNIPTCRISVEREISPNNFMLFILKNFYHDKMGNISFDSLECPFKLSAKIKDVEKLHIHFSVKNAG